MVESSCWHQYEVDDDQMKLHTYGRAKGIDHSIIGRIRTIDSLVSPDEMDAILLWQRQDVPPESLRKVPILTSIVQPNWNHAPLMHSAYNLESVSDGDVVSLEPNGMVRFLYRRNSPHNTIFATGQCNSFCLMCSQPPTRINDFDRIGEHLRVVELMSDETMEVGISGGEPTLLKRDFLRLIEHLKVNLPNTAVHVLTNGRLFFYKRFAQELGALSHPNLMLGIPVYSDIDADHDYIVQAKGAFDETILGLHHLAQFRVAVEIRVVLHALTQTRLVRTAEFIARNLPFASHVALMGMEMVGFVHKNLQELWIDPVDYMKELEDATFILASAGMNVSIYNLQLCILPSKLHPYARKSISDWKNVYLAECANCSVKDDCAGFFQSATKKHSAYIKPFSTPSGAPNEFAQ